MYAHANSDIQKFNLTFKNLHFYSIYANNIIKKYIYKNAISQKYIN